MRLTDFFLLCLLIEFTVIVFCLSFLGIERLVTIYKKNKQKKAETKLSSFLLKNLSAEEKLKVINLPKGISPSTILTVLEHFNHVLAGEKWESTRQLITEKFLLPLARKQYNSFFWQKRLLAARALALYPQKKDKPLISLLMHDSVFLVEAKAGLAAIKLYDYSLLHQLIKKLSLSRGYDRLYFKDLLKAESHEVFCFLERIAQENPDSPSHLLCLEILTIKAFPLHLLSIEKELESEDLKIRVAAIKLLAHNPQPDSLALILGYTHKKEYRQDPSVRAEVLLALSHFPSESTIAFLEKALDDDVWKVRLTAASSLKKMGEPALKILQKQKENTKAKEIADYVLTFT